MLTEMNLSLKMIKLNLVFFDFCYGMSFVSSILVVTFCRCLKRLLTFKIVVKINVKYFRNDLFLTTQFHFPTVKNTNDFRQKGTSTSKG